MDAGWEEVERMAQAVDAADANLASQHPSRDTIERWKNLFGYSDMETVRLIENQRGDVTRDRITDQHWDLIKDDKQAIGYDREAYEHSIQLTEVFKSQSASIPTTGVDGELMLLFRLGGLLNSPEKVKEVAGLDELPMVKEGTSEMGIVNFCLVDKEVQKRLEEWLTQYAVLQK